MRLDELKARAEAQAHGLTVKGTLDLRLRKFDQKRFLTEIDSILDDTGTSGVVLGAPFSSVVSINGTADSGAEGASTDDIFGEGAAEMGTPPQESASIFD